MWFGFETREQPPLINDNGGVVEREAETIWAAVRRTFAHSLERAHLSTVLHHVDGEVNLGQRLLLLNCANGIVNLDGPSRLLVGGVIVFGVHGGD